MSERKRWNNIKALTVVLTIGCLIVPLIPVGYADSYTAVTVSSNNSVSSSYYTVGFYKYNSPDDTTPSTIDFTNSDFDTKFTPATLYINAGGTFDYTNGAIQHKNAAVTVTPANLYFVITSTQYSDGTTYNVTDFDFKFTYNDSPIGGNNYSSSLTVGGSTIDSSHHPAIITTRAYQVVLKVTISQDIAVATKDVLCDFHITSAITNASSGISAVTGCDAGLMVHDSVIDPIINNNDPSGYDVKPSTNAGEYGGNSAVTVVNEQNTQGGIGPMSGNGRIDVTINIPTGTKFAIAIYNKIGYTKDQKNLSLTISRNNTAVYQNTNFTINASTGTNTLYYYQINGVFVVNQTSLPADDQWIQLDGNISLTIYRKQGGGGGSEKVDPNMKVDIVIKPP